MYTLIGYLPNGDSYSMGCHMGSSSSDLVLFYTEDHDELIKECLKLHKIDFEDGNYEAFEITVLKNGVDIRESLDGDWFFSELGELHSKARDVWKQEAEEAKALRQLQERNNQRSADLQQLARLQERLGVVA